MALGPDIQNNWCSKSEYRHRPLIMSTLGAMNDIQHVTDLIIGFFRALDRRDDEAAGKAFAIDGIWHRQGVALRGPAEISEVLAARPADRRSVHVVTNFAVTPTAEGGYVARYYLTGYLASGDAPLAPSAILDCRDEIERIDGRLKIRLKTSELLGHCS